MHRPQARLIHSLSSRVAVLRQNIAGAAAATAAALFAEIGALEKAAERLSRQLNRYRRWNARHSAYYAAGLNGKRAVERRRRQIAAGSLGTANGLEVTGLWERNEDGQMFFCPRSTTFGRGGTLSERPEHEPA